MRSGIRSRGRISARSVLSFRRLALRLAARAVTEPARGLPDGSTAAAQTYKDLQPAGNGHSIGLNTNFGNTLGNTTQTRAPAS
jgi:hypothetical protein